MPGGDRTGPLGQGPMTGGGFGRGSGRGFGRGRARGWRHRWWAGPYDPYVAPPVYPYVPQYSDKEEAEILRQEAKNLEISLEEIEKRLSQLE